MRTSLRWMITMLALLPASAAMATEPPPAPPVEKRELIFCADRMTHEEREAYRAKMRAARSLEEKEALRAAHRTEMRGRAAGQGGGPCEPFGRQWRGGQGK